ncbi:hypothetical protein PV327_009453 [Microctonus hyperodae]|uniref:Metabotropic glutamate receptor 2 n=1 Tax=Microctonus hyperodae TaxID=165561 RepID=A0AA39FTU4_MICHY|nr:hypothetical protein PV327_009453 [Microctonus hyperodae]
MWSELYVTGMKIFFKSLYFVLKKIEEVDVLTYAEEHFPNENKSTTNSDNNNNLLLKAPVNNKPSEFHVNEIDVIKEIAINSRKLNRFKDKKFVIANANGPVFSYPSSMEMKKDSDGRYLQTKDLSRSRLPLLYQPKDKKFFKLLNLLNLKNNSNKEHVLCKRLPVEYEISMRNISISIHHKILESTEYEKNKKKEQVKMSSNEKTLKPIKKNIPMKHHDLLSINKSIRNNVMKTSDTTFKLPLTVLTKFSSSPPCVKHETSLANEESRDKNQAIQPKQVREFQLDEEFSQIPATIKTSSDTTKFNNEKYTNNYYDEIMMTKYSNYYDKLKDVTSSFSSFSSSFVDKKITKINTRKKTPIKRMTREVSPNEIDEKLLFASNIERKKSFKIIASSFIDKNKLSNSTNGNISLPHYQNTSSINDQLKNHMKISLLNETDNISLISSMPDSKSSDVHEHLPTSIITSNSKSPSDANTSLTIKLYSGDYELDVDSARNIVPLETTARTIENLTSQTETVTLCDKKLLGMSGVSETITDIKFLENAIKPNLNWSISHDKVGPVISALSNNRKKLIVHNEEGVNADSEIPIGNETLEISAKNNDRIHHRILNSTLTVNNEHQTITNEYRLPIPLSNSQLDVIQSQTKIGNVKIQLNKVALSDKNIDNATVKSATAIQTQMQNKEWKNIARNNNDNTSSLSINANGISDRMFNDLENHMSLSTTENVRTIVHSDARTLADSRNSEHENSTRVLLNQWPVKHNAIVEGNLVLGGLMMVHEREDTVTCGPVMAQGGIQALEAMLYTLDWLNERNIVPGVKIGAHILDDCDKDTYGLEMAVDFIKGQ